MDVIGILTLNVMLSPFIMALIHSFLAGLALVCMFAFAYYGYGAILGRNKWIHSIQPFVFILVAYFFVQYYENKFMTCGEIYYSQDEDSRGSYKNCNFKDGRGFVYNNKFPVMTYVPLIDK